MVSSASVDGSGARVLATCIYPIKACGAMPVPALTIDRWGGAEGDRRWAVVNAAGEVTWMGDHPRLVLIAPSLGPGTLALSAPGQPGMVVPDGDTLVPCITHIWNDQAKCHESFACHDAGDAAAAWVSAVARAPVRLVRLGDEAVGRDSANRLHVISAESCAEVDTALQRRGEAPAAGRRYRANIVIQGAPEPLMPFLEDHLAAVHWQHEGRRAGLKATARCVRCVVPNVDHRTGEPRPELLQTLADLSAQRLPGEAVSFGAYGHATPGAVLREGQAITLEYSF